MSEGYLERALVKLARQINAYDESSLMSLWEKYAEKVRRFEPTRRWEESALVFSLIQGMRLKNQLFNYNWAQSRVPEGARDVDLAALTAPRDDDSGDEHDGGCESCAKNRRPDPAPKKGKLLQLRPQGAPEPEQEPGPDTEDAAQDDDGGDGEDA